MTQATQPVEEQAGQKNQTDQENSAVQAQSVELSEASGTQTAGASASIDILLDMDVPVVVNIGQTEIPIQQLLKLGPGSVLKLNKSVDSPADLYLKDIKFASGSIVIVEDKFAVRIKEIFGPAATAVADKK